MTATCQKRMGAYYTPEPVARTLVRWAIRNSADRMLDPACGDGCFLQYHLASLGVEEDVEAASASRLRCPDSIVHEGEFFTWAAKTNERFECAAGNPPFIRFQRFSGPTRNEALKLCKRAGVEFSALTSSWAPFLVGAASLLKQGGRMAFVVPAEIGHAPYAGPLLSYLANHFTTVRVIAVREKLFPDLSEDCWLLYCDGYGSRATGFEVTVMERFNNPRQPPRPDTFVSLSEWESWHRKLRTAILPNAVRDFYAAARKSCDYCHLADVAQVGIGYVTGANDFFHLRPSEAKFLDIPKKYLVPAIRNGRDLTSDRITPELVAQWMRQDRPNLLLRLTATDILPATIRSYLESDGGNAARESYKCRNRRPWYAVPDVRVADGFLTYMSGRVPSLVVNQARCVGTNSVHLVRMKVGHSFDTLQRAWRNPVTELSCEIEGHPLGGGLLKLEPREAGRVLIPISPSSSKRELQLALDGLSWLRRWRHCG